MQNMNLRNENFILQKVSHFIARYQVKCLIFLLFVIGLQPSKNTIYSITDLDYSIVFCRILGYYYIQQPLTRYIVVFLLFDKTFASGLSFSNWVCP